MVHGRMMGSHHIREFLRAMKMIRKDAMMKMAFFRASYAPTIFSLSCRGTESACVCVWKIRIRDPTDPHRVTCYFLQTNKQRRFVKLRFPVPGKPTVCMPIYTWLQFTNDQTTKATTTVPIHSTILWHAYCYVRNTDSTNQTTAFTKLSDYAVHLYSCFRECIYFFWCVGTFYGAV